MLQSLDTNILLYAINADCPEHRICAGLVNRALQQGDEWIIADQVWVELYRLLRNPAVLSKPLSAGEAADTIAWYRNATGWQHCAWESGMMPKLASRWSLDSFPVQRSFDLILAITLKEHGVEVLHTCNAKDFEGLGFFMVVNPLE
ncbi:MAG: VapC toxin family PIN domain ribonuclease [Spirochaetae bacterium HGW-Spirochaetae-7]|jgi:predicted nucleic acid-binding protein|nr:MAG: VapC toxin family PIN domain ribonuclease [Spirochaetae bacterium HGW-Spirochaetae-7]